MPQRAKSINLGPALGPFANAAMLIAEAGRARYQGKAAEGAGIGGGLQAAGAQIAHAKDRRSREKMEAERLATTKQLEGLRLKMEQGRLNLAERKLTKELEFKAQQLQTSRAITNANIFLQKSNDAQAAWQAYVEKANKAGVPVDPTVKQKFAEQHARYVEGFNANTKLAFPNMNPAKIAPEMLPVFERALGEIKSEEEGGVRGMMGKVQLLTSQLAEAREDDNYAMIDRLSTELGRAKSDLQSILKVEKEKADAKREGIARAKAERVATSNAREAFTHGVEFAKNLLRSAGKPTTLTTKQKEDLRISALTATRTGRNPQVAVEQTAHAFLPPTMTGQEMGQRRLEAYKTYVEGLKEAGLRVPGSRMSAEESYADKEKKRKLDEPRKRSLAKQELRWRLMEIGLDARERDTWDEDDEHDAEALEGKVMADYGIVAGG